MNLTIVLVLLALVAVAFAQDPECPNVHLKVIPGTWINVHSILILSSLGSIHSKLPVRRKKCDMNMSGKKCAAEEVFPACLAPSLNWENCVCPPGTRCHLMENDACAFSCEPIGDEVDDNNAGMGPGNGMD